MIATNSFIPKQHTAKEKDDNWGWWEDPYTKKDVLKRWQKYIKRYMNLRIFKTKTK